MFCKRFGGYSDQRCARTRGRNLASDDILPKRKHLIERGGGYFCRKDYGHHRDITSDSHGPYKRDANICARAVHVFLHTSTSFS